MQKCKYTFDTNGNPIAIDSIKTLIQKSDEYAEKGIRFIALAVSNEVIEGDKHLPEQMTFLGIIGIRDEIRQESNAAINTALNAGIQVVMITGDRKGTAESIAKDVGLLSSENDLIFTSAELQKYTDEELKELLPRLKVVARALPTDKSRLVRIAKSVGKVVGMTGDGVNDSPALKQSDVGFAMGSGSDFWPLKLLKKQNRKDFAVLITCSDPTNCNNQSAF